MRDILKLFLIGLAVAIPLYALSWILTCGIIKLITLCFGLSFNWLIATGIWLIMCVVKNILKRE